jgi:hypothetical protein
VAQRTAASLDGTLGAESQLGAGSLFVLRLPERHVKRQQNEEVDVPEIHENGTIVRYLNSELLSSGWWSLFATGQTSSLRNWARTVQET